jgi:SAM-dependent methyltransferase
MGIPRMIARAVVQEHKYKPITGNGLLIGRQTMSLTVDEAVALVESEGVKPNSSVLSGAKNLTDNETRAGKGRGFIKDTAFFSLFSDATFKALDVTDYEGAEIVHNMHEPVPLSLHNTVDFMWNGSCLDNMADPMAAMRNTVNMLKPGGRVVMMEMGTPHHGSYLMYSPAWFFDFFAINNFADCKVYVCLFEPTHYAMVKGPLDLFVWKDFQATLRKFPYDLLPWHKAVLIYTVAEKGPDSTADRCPIQGQYRQDHEPYVKSFNRFAASPRPLLRRKPSEMTMTQSYDLVSTVDTTVEFMDVEFLGSLEG